ncbi:MAG: MFS transporter, partial [Nonomuraea sp.]|nr:MFS transporter [Nonomuraea sp.]
STAKEIGGAMGLAVFVAVATAGSGLLDGLHTAGWAAAAVTAAGGLLALLLKPATTRQEAEPLLKEEITS